FRSRLDDKPAPVTVDLHNVPLKEALDVIFRNQPFGYTIKNDMILVGLEKKNHRLPTGGHSPTGVPVQQRFVTGTVTDENGNPLPGVNVRVRETNFSAITDAKGQYRIRIRNENSILLFSYMGYAQHEDRVGDRNTI